MTVHYNTEGEVWATPGDDGSFKRVNVLTAFASAHLKSEADEYSISTPGGELRKHRPPHQWLEVTLWDTKPASLDALCDLCDICGDDLSVRVVGTHY